VPADTAGPADRHRLVCRRAAVRPPLDGLLAGAPWDTATRSPTFVDMETGAPGFYDTQVAVLYDDHALYAGFWIEEPHPAAVLTERDSLIFAENDVEIFVDGGDAYYELEINALNTVYEVLFVWRDTYIAGGRFDVPELDLRAAGASTFGGNFDRDTATFWTGTHPRGQRFAFRDWDLPGLRTAVTVQGALNDPSVRSEGWRVEVEIPWTGLALVAGDRPCPPEPGDEWRMFFGRFQQLAVGTTPINPAWCLTPHGEYDTHRPERFTTVVFSES